MDNQAENYFPCTLFSDESTYTICIESESEKVFNTYVPLFEKYGYSGNGYCWEGHLLQLIEKQAPDLLEHLAFDSEAGAMYVNMESADVQLALAGLIHQVCSDLKRFEKYIKSADRDMIDD